MVDKLPNEAQAMQSAIGYFNDQIVSGSEEVKLYDDSGEHKYLKVVKQVITERVNVSDMVSLFIDFYGKEFSSNYIAREVVETYYEGRDYVDFVVYRRESDNKIIGLFIEEWLYYGETRFLPYHMKLREAISKMVSKRKV